MLTLVNATRNDYWFRNLWRTCGILIKSSGLLDWIIKLVPIQCIPAMYLFEQKFSPKHLGPLCKKTCTCNDNWYLKKFPKKLKLTKFFQDKILKKEEVKRSHVLRLPVLDIGFSRADPWLRGYTNKTQTLGHPRYTYRKLIRTPRM